MASHNLLSCILLLFLLVLATNAATFMNSFPCSNNINKCKASLYHINNGIPLNQIASFYSVDSSQIKPILRGSQQDYLITVPCTCQQIKGTTGYFYDTVYGVQPNDTFSDVSNRIYSGQAWSAGGEDKSFIAGNLVEMHLVCGCVQKETQVVATYTVQPRDTLTSIAALLSAQVSDILSLNEMLRQNPGFIDVGWVLYVPIE